jgi:hypothetical protein
MVQNVFRKLYRISVYHTVGRANLNKPVKLTALGFCKTEVKLGSKRKIFIRTFKENGHIETAYLHYCILKTEKKKGGNQDAYT